MGVGREFAEAGEALLKCAEGHAFHYRGIKFVDIVAGTGDAEGACRSGLFAGSSIIEDRLHAGSEGDATDGAIVKVGVRAEAHHCHNFLALGDSADDVNAFQFGPEVAHGLGDVEHRRQFYDQALEMLA